jgi:hypothetical protein
MRRDLYRPRTIPVNIDPDSFRAHRSFEAAVAAQNERAARRLERRQPAIRRVSPPAARRVEHRPPDVRAA